MPSPHALGRCAALGGGGKLLPTLLSLYFYHARVCVLYSKYSCSFAFFAFVAVGGDVLCSLLHWGGPKTSSIVNICLFFVQYVPM